VKSLPRAVVSVAIVLAAVAAMPSAQAQNSATVTWGANPSSGDWSTAANWAANGSIVTTQTTGTVQLAFVSSTVLSTTNSVENISLNRLLLNQGGSTLNHTLSGSTILFANGSNLGIVQSGALSSVTVTVNNAMTATNSALSIQNLGNAHLVLNGAIRQLSAVAMTFRPAQSGTTGKITINGNFSGGSANNFGSSSDSLNGVVVINGTNTAALTGGNADILSGLVVMGHEGSLAGGFGNASGAATPIRFNSANGILGLTSASLAATSGTFSRFYATSGQTRRIQFNNSSGGFAAMDADLAVAITTATNASTLYTGTWGASATSWVANTGTLTLGHSTATGRLDLRNPQSFGAASGTARTINVLNGSAPIDAQLSGALSGSGNLVKIGGGALRLTAANTFSGTTFVNAGVLRIGDGGTNGSLPTSGVISGSAGAVLEFERSNNVVAGVDFPSVIGGAQNVRQLGTGALVFDATQTYTGTTFVDAGRFQVDGTGNLSSTAGVVINGGDLRWNSSSAYAQPLTFTSGTVSGTGTIGVAVTANGVIAPGNAGIGTLTVNSGVTWNAGNAWLFTLGAPAASLAAATSASDADLLSLTGGFTQGSGSTFTFDFSTSGSDGWYKLVDYASTNFTTGTNTSFAATNLPAGKTATFVVDSSSTALYVQIVPEPGTLALAGLGIGLAGLAASRRRRG